MNKSLNLDNVYQVLRPEDIPEIANIRQKTLDEYLRMVDQALRTRIAWLASGRDFTMTFNPDDKAWLSIRAELIVVLQKNGWVVEPTDGESYSGIVITLPQGVHKA